MAEMNTTREQEHESADWALQIKLAEKRQEVWEKRCERIVARYREDRGSAETGIGGRRMNILWSNVQTLLPCVYGRVPVPIAERRFLDQDIRGRVAAQILERALRYEVPNSGIPDTFEQAVQDYLLVGRGQAWIRYRPIIGKSSSYNDVGDDELSDSTGMPEDFDENQSPEQDEFNETDEPTDETPEEKLLSASVEVDYVHWKDFLHSHARYWKEVEWCARRLYMSRKELIDDFGEEVGNEVPLEMSPENKDDLKAVKESDRDTDGMKKAIVYEIWDKPTRKVYTIAKGYDGFLEDPRDDPLNLEGFFPCPRPLLATTTNDTLEPVPDYIEYQDQALEIDELTNRIDLLISALKVAGVYDASQKQLARLLDEQMENKLIPVSNWAAFSEKGGLQNAISLLPVKDIAAVLQGLFDARDKIKQDLYEVTGLSDIVRGQADPRETAQAVATKGRWGSLRLQKRQADVARWCRDVICIMGEVIAEHFPEQTLIEVSGAMYDDGIGGAAPTAPKPPEMPQAPPQGMMPPQAHPMLPSPGGMLGAGPGGPSPSPPSVGLPGPSLPPQVPNPMAQYAMAMGNYQAEMQRFQMKKQMLIQGAIELLRQEKLRGFRLDIETDSTIQTDAEADKASRIEFIKATTEYIAQAGEIGMKIPDSVPVLGKMLLFGVRGFRAGRDLESTIEEFVDKAEKDAAARQNSPPPPNPEMQKAAVELQATQAKSEAEIAKAKIDAQASAEDNAREMATKQMDAEIAKQQMAADMAKMHQEAEIRNAEFQQKMAEMNMRMEMMQREHGMKLEQMHHAHTQAMARFNQPNGVAE